MSSRPAPEERKRRGFLAFLAIAIAPTLLASACSGLPGSSGPAPSPDSEAAGGPSASDARLDLSRLPVPRTEFCDVLDEGRVAEALEGGVTDTAHYGNGDEVEVRPGLVDVSHEYGCVFEGGEGISARTWVFARPVAREEARMLVRRARRGRDCAFPDAVGFGSPGLTSVCEVPATGQSSPIVRARLEGLFGHSWLACEISEPLEASPGAQKPRADVVQRAEQWCVNVVTTVGARP